MNLIEAAARMAAAAVDIELAKHAALEEACLILEGRAKNLIGHPQAGWMPLAAETLARKDGINTPLLETGTLRSSITHTVIDSNHAEVGSDLDRAVWMELGTSRGTPPRSYLAKAAMESGPAVVKVVAKTVGAAIGAGLAGRRVHDFLELAHIAGEAFHSIKDLGEDLVTPEDETRKR
jgi:hypothetical protein